MAFRFDKLTTKAQEAVQRAQDLAADRGNPQIEPLHLLAGLLAETEGVVGPVLDKIGVNRQQLDRIVAAELGHLPKMSGGSGPQVSEALQKPSRRLSDWPPRCRTSSSRPSICCWRCAGRLEGQERPQAQRDR